MNQAVDEVALKSSIARKKKKLSMRYLSYLIHSFVGLKLTLLMTVVLLTGTIAVFQQELDWLIYPEMRASEQGPRLSDGELLDRLQAAYPEQGMFFFNTSQDHPHYNAYARFINEDGGWRSGWIDPYTGEVKGDTVLLSVGQFLGFLHATLFLPAIGSSLVNGLGLLVLISLVTGLLTFPRFWRHFLTKPRTGNMRVFIGDLHKLVGLWSLWIVLIIGVSGSWWFYMNPFVRYADAPNPVDPYPRKPLLSYEKLDALSEQGVPERLSSAELVAKAQALFPNLQISYINQPEHNADPFEIIAKPEQWLVSAWRGNRVWLDPYSGDLIGTADVADYSFGQRFDTAMVPLHYGTWAESGSSDLVVKTFWFLGGLAMTALSITGLMINLKRTAKTARKLKKLSPLRRRLTKTWWVMRPWGGSMSFFKYVNYLAVAGIVFGTGVTLTLSSQGTKGSGFLYEEKMVGPWPVSMNAVAGLLEKDLPPIRAGAKTNLNVDISADALKEIKFIYARVGKPRSMRAPGTLIHGPLGVKHVVLPIPKRLKDDAEVWITAQTWDGKVHQASWSLMPNGKETIDAR